jgi:hypothetical protein
LVSFVYSTCTLSTVFQAQHRFAPQVGTADYVARTLGLALLASLRGGSWATRAGPPAHPRQTGAVRTLSPVGAKSPGHRTNGGRLPLLSSKENAGLPWCWLRKQIFQCVLRVSTYQFVGGEWFLGWSNFAKVTAFMQYARHKCRL